MKSMIVYLPDWLHDLLKDFAKERGLSLVNAIFLILEKELCKEKEKEQGADLKNFVKRKTK